MLDKNKTYKKGQLVTINKSLYRVTSINDSATCGLCPLVAVNCIKPLGVHLCLKLVKQ